MLALHAMRCAHMSAALALAAHEKACPGQPGSVRGARSWVAMLLRIGTEDVRVGRMIESEDAPAAARSLAEHGYALMRQVIPPALVRKGGERIAAELQAEGWLHPDAASEELLAADDVGGGMLSVDAAHTVANDPAVRRCIQAPEIFALFDALFGEESISLDFKWFRAIRGHATSGSGAGLHMDNVYMGRGSQQLHTVWLPWHDVPIERGGLAVLAGSNRLPGIHYFRINLQ